MRVHPVVKILSLHLRLPSGATMDADVPSGTALPAEGAAVHLEFHPDRARLFTREAGPVKGGTTVIAFVTDPDGYKIELIQRAESSAPVTLR